jgi:carbon monoxide dehydrogenase subunit G
MDMTGEYRIAAPRQKVWEALNDPEVLKQCIPGCEEIDKQSDTEMTAKVTAKVGPVKARFGGKVTLSDLDPPNGYKISGEGSGGAAGFAKGGAAVRLADEGAGTLLTYKVEAHVGGKIAQIGSRLIDATARKMADDFFARFAATVGGPAPEAAPAVAAAPAAPAPSEAPAPAPEIAPAPAPATAAPVGAAPAVTMAPPAGRPETKRLPPMIWVPVLAAIVALLLYFFTGFGGSH